jgi:hypothetical protein
MGPQLKLLTRGARPAEVVLLCLGLGLIFFSIGTVSPLVDGDGINAKRWTHASCDQDMGAPSSSCQLAGGGVLGPALMRLTLVVGLLLGLCFVAQELDQRELLGELRARLQHVPFNRLQDVPLLGWVSSA